MDHQHPDAFVPGWRGLIDEAGVRAAFATTDHSTNPVERSLPRRAGHTGFASDRC